MNSDKPSLREQLRKDCRWLHGHGPERLADLLARTAAWCAEHDVQSDVYGTGALIEDFEARVAALLGFPKARFMPSGTMAQQIALRVWSERSGLTHVGMHPTSHLELHEQHGYVHLHGLRATLVGAKDAPLLAADFEAVSERMAALLIELPIREAGGQCPTWRELDALKSAARATDTRLHLDGARLWECAAGYGRSYAEICAGFDSCYVSFYKGIGALSGAMLLGNQTFIEQATIWQRRCGGNLYTLAPNVASAAMLFDERLARMPIYFERAKRIAEIASGIDGIEVLPNPPHTNMMHLRFAMDAETVMEARDRVARANGVWLFTTARAADGPDHCRVELYIGEAALGLDDATVEAGFRALTGERRPG